MRGDRAENLELAIHHYTQALEVYTRQAFPESWAGTQNNLANAYRNRMRGDRAENLERALHHYTQALEVRTRQAFPADWAQTQNNLANAYADRMRGDRAENLELALHHYTQALEVRTRQAFPADWAGTQNNLANAYRNRMRGDRAENLEQALHHYTQALEVYTRQAFPYEHRGTQRNLANLSFEEERWDEAATALQGALAATNLLYQAAATPEARQAELQEIRALPSHLAYALTQSAEQTDGTSLQQAVLNLERNRARWLSETLALRSQKPPDVPEGVWQTFTSRRERIGDLQAELRLPEDTPGRRKYLTLSPALTAAYTDLDETLSEIRDYDETFMPDPTFEQIQGSAEADHPLVYIAVSSAGTAAFIVTPSAIHHIQMPLTADALETKLNAWVRAYGNWLSARGDLKRAVREAQEQGLPKREQLAHILPFQQALDAAQSGWFNTLQTTVDWLATDIMTPIVDTLTGNDYTRATLIPTGQLGLLPLHSAALDASVTFTYAPNARALTAAREIAERIPPEDYDLFAVDNPLGDLTDSEQAIAAVSAHFENPWVAPNSQATHRTALKGLRDTTVYHFFCHGSHNWQEVLESGLALYGKTLTLRDILRVKSSGARLAFLSACETGILDYNIADEVINLPTGFLQAGVAGVIGTLWSVAERSTALLVEKFYELWLEEGCDPPEALREAQLWLRDEAPGDWSAPFYWAGFTYTGV